MVSSNDNEHQHFPFNFVDLETHYLVTEKLNFYSLQDGITVVSQHKDTLLNVYYCYVF